MVVQPANILASRTYHEVGRFSNMGEGEIVDVWSDNFLDVMALIREIVEEYPFVSMDTEFPGVVARPIGNLNKNEYNYQQLRVNVDMLKLIQLGLTFSDEEGNTPLGACTFQFHFQFDLKYVRYTV